MLAPLLFFFFFFLNDPPPPKFSPFPHPAPLPSPRLARRRRPGSSSHRSRRGRLEAGPGHGPRRPAAFGPPLCLLVREGQGLDRLRLLPARTRRRSEEHTSELQSLAYLVCRLLLEK